MRRANWSSVLGIGRHRCLSVFFGRLLVLWDSSGVGWGREEGYPAFVVVVAVFAAAADEAAVAVIGGVSPLRGLT